MRYVLAGGLVFAGVLLVGLAVHDTVSDAWKVLSQ